MKVSKIWKIIKIEGKDTAIHLFKEKLSERRSDEKRYERYIRFVEPQINEKYLSAEVLNESELLSTYVVLLEPHYMLDEKWKKVVSGYVLKQQQRGVVPDVIYANEDHMYFNSGKRFDPVFKPEYSPNTLWSFNYIGGFVCVRRDILKESPEITDNFQKRMETENLDGVIGVSSKSMYEILLRLSMKDNLSVCLIHSVLVHQIVDLDNLSYQKTQIHVANESMKKDSLQKLKNELLKESDVRAEVINRGDGTLVQYVDYAYDKQLISIIIPSKDNPNLLEKSIESIRENTMQSKYEIIVVDNGSNEKNKVGYKSVLQRYEEKTGNHTEYHYEPMEFNFSKMCNLGAGYAKGTLLLFLNDDVEIIPQKYCTNMCRDWLAILAGQALQKSVGAVGVKLLYPDSNKIQHIGVVNYEDACLAHLYAKQDDDENVRDYRNTAVYDYLCVTGACIMVETEKFWQVKGFEEQLTVTHNDIDLCMKLYEHGYASIQRNDIVLIHHESLSRGIDVVDETKELRTMRERELLYTLHPQLERYDPYYSPCRSQLEFDYRVNPDIYSIIYTKPQEVSLSEVEKIRKLHTVNKDVYEYGFNAQVTMAEFREDLQIRGYVYRVTQEKITACRNPWMLIYNDKQAYGLQAKSICDRVFHKRKGLKEHINEAPFFCGVDTNEMRGGEYNVAILIMDRIGKEKVILQMKRKIQINNN